MTELRFVSLRELVQGLLTHAESLDDPVAFVTENSGQIAAFSGTGVFTMRIGSADEVNLLCIRINLDQAWSGSDGSTLESGAMTFLVDGDD